MGVLAVRSLARAGALGLLAGGTVTTIGLGLRLPGPAGTVGTCWGLLLSAFGAAATVRPLPWRRPLGVATLPVLGWAALAVAAALVGGTLPGSAAAMVAVACCGLALPPGRILLLAPWVLLTAVAPTALASAGPLAAGPPLAVTVVTVAVGEGLAALAARIRAAEAEAGHRAEALATLVEASLELAAVSEPETAGGVAVAAAVALAAAGRAALLVTDDGGERVLATYPLEQENGDAAADLPAGLGIAVRPGGLLLLDLPEEAVDGFTGNCLRTLSVQAGLALERLRTAASLRASLDVDPLTGVGNRRRLEATLADLDPGDLVVLIDLDHFKSVNDTLGHAAGDRVLTSLARHLTDAVREAEGDVVCRLGGEEFVLVLRGGGTGARRAAGLVGRVGADWVRRGPVTTFSAGAAAHDGGDPEETLAAADEALYAAKDAGRARGIVCGLEGEIPFTRTTPVVPPPRGPGVPAANRRPVPAPRAPRPRAS